MDIWRTEEDDRQEQPSFTRAENKPRWGLVAAIAGLHVLALFGLARAFAPDLTRAVMDSAASLVTVSITTPPEPSPSPSPEPSRRDEGAAGAESRQAKPKEVVAPPKVPPRIVVAPPAASTGDSTRSGAGEQGEGTGAGGSGNGTGSGRFGNGQGGIAVTRPEKIAGDINDARDYPVPPGGRKVRLGHQVIVYMTVGTDGRARNCRVTEPSPDPEADRITCRLAEERFRFRPAIDAAGNPVEAEYGWRQRWF